MKKKLHLLVPVFCALSLSACVDREQADIKLAKACTAAANAVLPDGESVPPVTENTFTPAVDAPNTRHVTLTVKNEDGWIEEVMAYECVFEDHFGFMNTSYTASFVNLKFGEQTYGKFGDELRGEATDFIKLTDAIRTALYE